MATGLAERELLVVTGKGGVGKSAVTAALGRALAARGRRALLLETDPRESIHQMFEAPPSDGELRKVAAGLWLQNLEPRRVLDQVVRERVKIGWAIRRVLASPIYQHFADGGPGLKELALLGHALLAATGRVPGFPPLDTVVLDAPATGHGVSLLAAPGVVAQVLHRGPFGAMTAEVADWIRDPARVAVVAVTQAEEMPVSEALELDALLGERLGRGADLLVVNGLYPPVPARLGEPGAAAETSTELWRRRRRLNERELARLERQWSGRRVEVPLLPLERGPELARALAERLDGALDAGPRPAARGAGSGSGGSRGRRGATTGRGGGGPSGAAPR